MNANMTDRPHHLRRRSGYVLLLTLLVLALAAVAMAGVCRHSLRLALQATRAQHDLQTRWGTTGIETTFLPAAGDWLSRHEKRAGHVETSARSEIILGGQRFTFLVADEEAKINVNTLYDRGDASRTQSMVREFARAGGGDVAVRLQPLYGPGRVRARSGAIQKLGGAAAASGPAIGRGAGASLRPATARVVAAATLPPAFETLGQVFDELPPGRWAGLPSGRAAAGELTCWGNGKLNARRASPQAIAAVGSLCAPPLNRTAAARLSGLLRQNPPISLNEAIAAMSLPREQVGQLGEVLQNTSGSYSLWIVAEDGDRAWYHLAVSDQGNPAAGIAARTVSMEW